MGVVYQIEDLDNSSKDLNAQSFQIIVCLSGLTDRKKPFKRSLDKLGMTAFSARDDSVFSLDDSDFSRHDNDFSRDDSVWGFCIL